MSENSIEMMYATIFNILLLPLPLSVLQFIDPITFNVTAQQKHILTAIALILAIRTFCDTVAHLLQIQALEWFGWALELGKLQKNE